MSCDPVSVAEIAGILGVTRQRVNQLMHERDDFPEPLAALAIGRIWRREDIERWAQDLHRRPGRRPHAGETLVGKSGGNRPPSGGAGGSGGGRKPRPA